MSSSMWCDYPRATRDVMWWLIRRMREGGQVLKVNGRSCTLVSENIPQCDVAFKLMGDIMQGLRTLKDEGNISGDTAPMRQVHILDYKPDNRDAFLEVASIGLVGSGVAGTVSWNDTTLNI